MENLRKKINLIKSNNDELTNAIIFKHVFLYDYVMTHLKKKFKNRKQMEATKRYQIKNRERYNEMKRKNNKRYYKYDDTEKQKKKEYYQYNKEVTRLFNIQL